MSDNTEALVVAQPLPPAPAALFNGSPNDVIARATEAANALKDVLKQRGLISNISGKEYPRCEAWTLLGNMVGVFPVLVWTHPVDGGWEARVEARTIAGAIVGAAEAQCLRAEKNWSNRDDFALRSMAQTRATAKCLRMPLGFVMSIAGYEPTPAEEMVADHQHKSPPPSVQAPAPKVAPGAKSNDKAASAPAETPEQRKTRWLEECIKAGGGHGDYAEEVFRDIGVLLPNEHLVDFPETKVPTTRKVADQLLEQIRQKAGVGEPPDDAPTHIDVPPEEDDEPWRVYPVPFGKDAGKALGTLDKKVLFGWWANYKVETEYNGKPRKKETIERDREFREMLDAAGVHYQFTKKD